MFLKWQTHLLRCFSFFGGNSFQFQISEKQIRDEINLSEIIYLKPQINYKNTLPVGATVLFVYFFDAFENYIWKGYIWLLNINQFKLIFYDTQVKTSITQKYLQGQAYKKV